MYVDRSIDSELLQWKEETHRKPLILRGVRQCGKTEAVRHLGQSFRYYIEINFEKSRQLHALFESDISVASILARFELESGAPAADGETLLFLDEIQECPRAITALRYFYEERPGLHVIAAGSLLEFVLNRPRKERIQFPVGRVRSIYMYPFSFREYLTAIGQPMLQKLLLHPETLAENNIAHDRFLDCFKDFLIVGGMPEAVVRFAQTHSFLECQRIHRDIVVNFKEDFDKYDSHVSSEALRMVFEYSLHHACGQIRPSSAVPGMSAYAFKNAYELLRRAGIVLPVVASSCETLPLGSGEKGTNQKLLPFDTGIFLTELGLSAGDILGATAFDELNKGNLAELAAGLELLKASDPYSEAGLYYWYRSGANAEVDYAVQRNREIIPIEVKASVKGGMKSLHSFLETHASSYGIRVSLENYASYDRIRVVPLYAVCGI